MTNHVPGPDGKLVFASVQREAIEIMYQTRASVLAEGPQTAAELAGHSVALFLQVADVAAVEAAVKGAPVVKARHKTFYGSDEIYVRATVVSSRRPANPYHKDDFETAWVQPVAVRRSK